MVSSKVLDLECPLKAFHFEPDCFQKAIVDVHFPWLLPLPMPEWARTNFKTIELPNGFTYLLLVVSVKKLDNP